MPYHAGRPRMNYLEHYDIADMSSERHLLRLGRRSQGPRPLHQKRPATVLAGRLSQPAARQAAPLIIGERLVQPESPFDICKCGDYRRDHRRQGGGCIFNKPGLGHHGAGDCEKFEFLRHDNVAITRQPDGAPRA